VGDAALADRVRERGHDASCRLARDLCLVRDYDQLCSVGVSH
jgi:hypothetical protein